MMQMITQIQSDFDKKVVTKKLVKLDHSYRSTNYQNISHSKIKTDKDIWNTDTILRLYPWLVHEITENWLPLRLLDGSITLGTWRLAKAILIGRIATKN